MKEKTTKITDFLALMVFAVFALCLCLVLLTGAKELCYHAKAESP